MGSLFGGKKVKFSNVEKGKWNHDYKSLCPDSFSVYCDGVPDGLIVYNPGIAVSTSSEASLWDIMYNRIYRKGRYCKLDGISNGLCDGFYAVNNGMQTGFNGIQMNMMQGNFGLQQAINANNIAAMQNANALQTQLADCCCQNKQGQAQIMYNMATDTCAITTAINNQTQAIMQNDNNNYRALHDEMVANRMADKDEIIAQLRTQLNQCTLATSQQAQNQYLISQLRPSAVPAYLVENPFRSTGNLPCQQPTCCNG